MKVTKVAVTYAETFSMEGYQNCRPSVTIEAEVFEGEAPDHARTDLMAQAIDEVRDVIDSTLEANNQSPHYFDGTRFELWSSPARKCLIIVPYETDDLPSDFNKAFFGLPYYGMRFGFVRARALERSAENGWAVIDSPIDRDDWAIIDSPIDRDDFLVEEDREEQADGEEISEIPL